MARPKKNHYIINDEFTAHILKYSEQYRASKLDKNIPPPEFTPYMFSCFRQMAKGMTCSMRYIGYDQDYKDDMISMAYEDCFRACHNFTADKIINGKAFGYFNVIIANAFKRHTEAETKQMFSKFASIESLDMDQLYSDDDFDENSKHSLDDAIKKYHRSREIWDNNQKLKKEKKKLKVEN